MMARITPPVNIYDIGKRTADVLRAHPVVSHFSPASKHQVAYLLLMTSSFLGDQPDMLIDTSQVYGLASDGPLLTYIMIRSSRNTMITFGVDIYSHLQQIMFFKPGDRSRDFVNLVVFIMCLLTA